MRDRCASDVHRSGDAARRLVLPGNLGSKSPTRAITRVNVPQHPLRENERHPRELCVPSTELSHPSPPLSTISSKVEKGKQPTFVTYKGAQHEMAEDRIPRPDSAR